MNQKLSAPPALETPTRVRYGVLGFVCSLSMVTYLDRVCFGAAGPDIKKAMGVGDGDIALFTWAFAFSYAIFEVPTGWLGDVFGPRKTLIRIVLWWSFFTVATGIVGFPTVVVFLGGMWAFWLMLLTRFLFGVGEAGAYPNITRALHNWFPFQDRAFAQGAIWMSGRLMGGLTPFVWMLVTQSAITWGGQSYGIGLGLPWYGAFYLFGGLGVIWCVAFAFWFRNRPDEKPSVNAAERELIEGGRRDIEAAHAGVPWKRLLTSGNLWTLCLMYFCMGYGWYFNISLLPTFLQDQYGVKPDDPLGSLYKGGPLWMGAITCLIGGWLSDFLIRRTGSRKWGRRVLGLVGHTLCASCYFIAIFIPVQAAYVFFFALAISLAAFWNDLTMGSAWAICQDIGKRYAAIVAGCMNTIGNLGGATTMLVTKYVLSAQEASYAAGLGKGVDQLSSAERIAAVLPGYHFNFALYGIVYVIAVFLWLRIDSTKPVVPEESM